MWAFMVAMKGKKLSSSLGAADRPEDPEVPGSFLLWHSIDKYPEELAMGNKCGHAKTLLTKFIKDKYQIEDPDVVDAGKDGGSVILLVKKIPALNSSIPIKLFQKGGPMSVLVVSKGAQAALDKLQFDYKLEDVIEEINDPPRP